MTTQTQPTSTETEHDPIREFVDGYEFRGDAGDYTPTEAERVMLEDFAHGLVDHFNITPSALGASIPMNTNRKRKVSGFAANRVQPADTTHPDREF